MIKIERNEEWKFPQIKLNASVLADFDKSSGQMKYHKHKLHIKSKLSKNENSKFESYFFLANLDNGDETISVTINSATYRNFERVKVEKGDIIEVQGAPYVNPRNNSLVTVINVKNLSKPFMQKKISEIKKPAPQFVEEWIEHFALMPDHNENTVENFVDTFKDDKRAMGLNEEQLKIMYKEFVKSK